METEKDLAEWYRESELFYNKSEMRAHKNSHKKQLPLCDKAASMNPLGGNVTLQERADVPHRPYSKM